MSLKQQYLYLIQKLYKSFSSSAIMLGLKVLLIDAEKCKKYIVDNGLLDKEHYYSKDKEHIYFPLKKKFVVPKNIDAAIVEKDFKKSLRKGTLKENLSKKLSSKEFEFVKTAHDIIGSIAIVEIPEDLRKREKIIAETLLQVNSHIKTVLRKADIHGGVYRTQKMIYLAGVNTKETIYRENNVQIKLDVEKVYFSIRLGNERKRIMNLVKPGEEILTMFSGCAPYCVVLSKNTAARHITGIEINPDGHKYGLENLKLNKIHNVLLINDDVHKVLPEIYKRIIGLKCSIIPLELKSRLKKNPTIMEIYLPDDGLSDKNIPALEKVIIKFKDLGMEVFMHMPHYINDRSLAPNCDESFHVLKKAGELCKKHYISAIVHLSNGEGISNEEQTIEYAKKLAQYYDYFYFENSIQSFDTKEEILRIARKAGFKNICLDLAHLYITYEDNKKIESTIKAVQKEFNTYFHVADHDKKIHTCELGKGFIDFERLLPLVNKGIIEVNSKDEKNPLESLGSYETLAKYHNKTYDRIIMPLPKTADEFLDDALVVSKKGTIIHFYDFLPESQFDEAVTKIDSACKKRGMKNKIIGIHKCGQHAPYIYRICVDFEIL